ncbi:hypothetical protein M23134_06401 [Microscilla marina ATCC 23134]|uniref:Uncharacterized protein n=1 Tax=Microscilla marina ATCC 23134 TaxID=313606 RepID=A1ZU81_MICM2|nr:hypothetical protein M23134_06401 [Microscilla marina ATCC 23134]
MLMRKRRTTKPRTVTVLQKLLETGIDFTITDLKHLNGSLFYFDWQRQDHYKEKANLATQTVPFGEQSNTANLFLFPASFEKKIESKIFYHFQRKIKSLYNHCEIDKNLHNLKQLETDFFKLNFKGLCNSKPHKTNSYLSSSPKKRPANYNRY